MKLTIAENDLRCTIAEGVRELLSEFLPANSVIHHAHATRIADAVVACGDPQPAPDAIPSTIATSLTKLEGVINTMLTSPMRAPARAALLVEAAIQVDNLRGNIETVVHAVAMASRTIHTDCKEMPGGTGPCACNDGCGSCDSCGQWLGDEPATESFASIEHMVAPNLMPSAEKFKPAPVCSHCNDSHAMDLDGRVVMCTRCPTPCEKCRQSGKGKTGPGAYCETTPCSCKCHEPKAEPMPSWTKPE